MGSVFPKNKLYFYFRRVYLGSSSFFGNRENHLSAYSYRPKYNYYNKSKWREWTLAAAVVASCAEYFRKKEVSSSRILNYVPSAACAQKVTNLREQFNFIADVVEQVVNSVVYIEAINTGARSFHGRMGNEAVSNGSGFIIAPDGLILTNAHVVVQQGADGVRVRLSDGSTYLAAVEHIDMQSDLATIRIKEKNLPVLKMGSSGDLRAGEWVMAIGSPLTLSNTVTAGVVSASQRPAKQLGIAHKDINYIQTDAPITFGSSGGPLVNLDGEAIGVNSITISSGISFAIPIDYVKEFLNNAKNKTADSKPSKKYIGITMVTLKPDMVFALQARGVLPVNVTWGVLVWKLQENGPAFRVGLKPGDVITHVNDALATSVQVVYEAIESSQPVRLHAVRNGHPIELTVHPEVRPVT